MATLFI